MGTFNYEEMKDKVPRITFATSIRYGNYKHYYDYAITLAGLTIENFLEIKKHINLPDKLTIHFRPIKGLWGKSYFTTFKENNRKCREYTVEIDVKQEIETFKDTLLHELVHTEQFYEKRLIAGSFDTDYFKWYNKKISLITKSGEEYDDLPWEREAIERSSKLVKIIFDEK